MRPWADLAPPTLVDCLSARYRSPPLQIVIPGADRKCWDPRLFTKQRIASFRSKMTSFHSALSTVDDDDPPCIRPRLDAAFGEKPPPQVPGAMPQPPPQVPGAMLQPPPQVPGAMPQPPPQVPGAMPQPPPQVPGAMPQPQPQAPGAMPQPQPQVHGAMPPQQPNQTKHSTQRCLHAIDTMCFPMAPPSALQQPQGQVMLQHVLMVQVAQPPGVSQRPFMQQPLPHPFPSAVPSPCQSVLLLPLSPQPLPQSQQPQSQQPIRAMPQPRPRFPPSHANHQSRQRMVQPPVTQAQQPFPHQPMASLAVRTTTPTSHAESTQGVQLSRQASPFTAPHCAMGMCGSSEVMGVPLASAEATATGGATCSNLSTTTLSPVDIPCSQPDPSRPPLTLAAVAEGERAEEEGAAEENGGEGGVEGGAEGENGADRGVGGEDVEGEGRWEGATTDGETADETLFGDFFDSLLSPEAPFAQSAPPSPPITPKPEPRESGTKNLLALVTLATLLLLSPLLLNLAQDGWARGEAYTSLSHAAPNRSAPVRDGCPVDWSAAPGGQYS